MCEHTDFAMKLNLWWKIFELEIHTKRICRNYWLRKTNSDMRSILFYSNIHFETLVFKLTKIICLMCGNHIQKIPFSESIANSVYVWWFMPARCWNERVNANISYHHKLTIPGKPKIIEKIKQNKTVVSVLLRKSCCC